MQSVIAGVVLGLTCWALSACEMDSSALPKSYRGLPFLSIPKLDALEKLSGDLSAAVWSRAAAVALNDPRGAATTYATEARVFCTRDALYVGFHCAEPNPDALSVSDPEIWKRDEVEIFLEPYEETLKRPYHHLMIDASGGTASGRYHIYPRYFRLKSGEQKWTPRLEIATAKSASGWTLEVRIPLDQMVFSDAAQSKDAMWRLNFCRSRPARGTDPAMTWSWSPLNSTAFQTPWRFGYALPEVFATESLRARVTAHPNADAPADSGSARVNDPSVVSAIDAGLDELSADGKFDAGMTRLKTLAYESPALYVLIASKANERVKTRGGSVRRDLQEFLYQLDRARPDEDPPADDVLAMIAQFEPHTYSDAASKSLNYRLLKPANFDPQKKYPLVLFMHGSGECGGDNWRQLFGGCLTYLREDIRAKYPSFVLAPQYPLGSQWADTRTNPLSVDVMRATSNYRAAEQPGETMRLLLDLIPQLEREYPSIDTSRLYVAGISLGGYGTWECLTRRPEWFAAAAPVCGGGDETLAARFAKVPLWIFHGAKDPGVKVQSSRNMVQALKDAGGSPRYTEYPEGLHNIGEHNTDPETLEWMFAQRLPR